MKIAFEGEVYAGRNDFELHLVVWDPPGRLRDSVQLGIDEGFGAVSPDRPAGKKELKLLRTSM